MLINRNRRPKVTVFKDRHISDSYVSKSETEGLIDDVSGKIDDHSNMINDNIGFDHCRGPREITHEMMTGVIKRTTNIKGIETRVDSSLLDQLNDNVTSYDISNDIIGKIIDDDNQSQTGTIFKGLTNKSYSKISYGNKRYIDKLTKYSPYSNLSLTDVVKSYSINDLLYSVHRGGFISITKVRESIDDENDTKIVNLIDNTSLMDEIKNKSEIYFPDFEMSNLVTNVSYSNDRIVVTTTNKIILFNLVDETVDIIDNFAISGTIIAMKLIDSDIYTISSSEDMSYEIKKYNINDNSTTTYIPSDTIEGFFPNSISKIGEDVIVYESSTKFGKHDLSNITFMILNSESVIREFQLPVNISTVYITGSSINKLYVGIDSDVKFLKNSIVVINNLNSVDYFQDNKGSCLITSTDVVFNNGFIISSDDKKLSIIKMDNNKVISTALIDLCKNKNTCDRIVDFSFNDNIVVINFEDNTHGIYDFETLKLFCNDNIVSFKNESFIELKVNSKIIIIDVDRMYILDNSDLNVMRSVSYDQFFTDQEFDNIKAIGWYSKNSDIVNISIVSTLENFVRVSMIVVNHTSDNSSIDMVNNMGWSESIIDVSADMIRFKEDLIFIPFSSESSNHTFLAVCDFEFEVVIRNVLTTSNYNKSLFINDSCDKLSIGIGDKVYIDTMPVNLYLINGEEVVNSVNNIDESTFTTDFKLNEINLNEVNADYAFFNDIDNTFNLDLITLNNNRVSNKPSKNIKIDGIILSLCDKFIKIYDEEYNLISLNKNAGELTDIISISQISSDKVILNTKTSSFIIKKDNIVIDDKPVIPFYNKNVKCISKDNVILTSEDNVINYLDSEFGVTYVDILNRLKRSNIKFSSDRHIIRPNTIDIFRDKVVITVSIFSKNTNSLYGNGVIITTPLDSTFEFLNYDESDSETQVSKVITNFTDTIEMDNKLYICYYNNGKIHCKVLNSDFTSYTLDNIHRITSDKLFLGMKCKSDGVYVLNNDLTFNSSDYTSKVDVDYTHPADANYYKVFRKGTRDFFILKVEENSISCYRKDINDEFNYSKTHDISSYTKLRPFIVNNFYNLDFSFNYSSNIFYILNTETQESIELGDTILSLINGYKTVGKLNPFCFSDNLFSYFTTSFTGFDNKSGMYRFLEFQEEIVNVNKYIEGFGDYLFLSESKLLEYDINPFNCIRDNEYDRLVYLGNESGNMFHSRMVNDNLEVKTLTYILNGESIIFTTTKYLSEVSGNIVVNEDEPIVDKSFVHKNLTDDLCNIILVKNKDASFGYEQMYMIDVDGQTVTNVNPAIEIKPVYFEVNDPSDYNLHSIGKNSNGDVYHIIDTFVDSSVVIQGFTDVLDAISVDSIEDSILLINEVGEVILYNVNDNDDGVKYTTILNVGDKIDGLPSGYSFLRIQSLSDNLTCNILVIDENDNYFIIPSCKIDISKQSDDITFKINAAMTGVFKGYEVNPIDLNRFNLPGNGSAQSEVILRDYMSFNHISDEGKNIKVTIGRLSIDKDLSEEEDVVQSIYEIYRDFESNIFVRGKKVIIQYDENIDICEIKNGIPNFTPIYKIIQGRYVTLKKIKDVMINNNMVLFSFYDNSCRVIDIRKESNVETIVDNGFHDYTEYRTLHEDVNYFISGCGAVIGYTTNDAVYIFDDIRFIKVSGSSVIKKTCIDKLYNRIYCVDDKNNFGYFDMLTGSYVGIRAFTNTIILSIVYTEFETVELITNRGVFSFMKGKFHKVCDYDGDYGRHNVIIYPWKNFSTT